MSAEPAASPSTARLLGALLLLLGTVAALVAALILVVLPDPAPRDLAPQTSATPALTQRLLFVVVDGLRFDIATDAAKMPNFARAMREHAHAEVWAGQVTMTTSAILSYGTARPGRFEQILRNLDPAPPEHNSWLENAKERGLTLMSVGDPAWVQMYGASLVEHREDPKGASIDVDFNHLTFRDTRELLQKKPNVLIAHFVTPDHQGHAHGVLSPRYLGHIRDFDQKLFKLLQELTKDVTVVVTSDHGAVDSGTHGSDTPVQRRCPAFAYGPGIVRGAAPAQSVPQVDLAPTFAVLLGVPMPAHGQGLPILEWLDVPPQTRADLACAEAQRATRYAQLAGASTEVGTSCAEQSDPKRREQVAREAVRAVEASLAKNTGIASPRAWGVGVVASVLLGLSVLLVFGKRAVAPLAVAAVLVALATWLVLDVERLSGLWPGRVRAALFVGLIGPAVALLLMPARVAAFAQRRPIFLAAYLPGLLCVAYPSNLQPLVWIGVFVLGVLLVRLPALTPKGPSLWRGTGSWLGVLLLALCFLLLLRVGTQASGMVPPWYGTSTALKWGGAIAAVACWTALRSTRVLSATITVPHAVVSAALVLGCFVSAEYLPAWPARAAVLALLLAALGSLHKGQAAWALSFGVASYALLARLWEVPWVLVTLVAAAVVGGALQPAPTQRAASRPSAFGRIALVSFLFCLILVQRLAIQGTQDIGGMDVGAGGFGDVNVSATLVGVFVAYKYALPALLLLLATLGALPLRDVVLPTLRLVFAALMLRGVALLAMLFVAGGSYWTGLRVLGELPFPLLFAAVVLAALTALTTYTAPSSSSCN